jgi:hypothetical protein
MSAQIPSISVEYARVRIIANVDLGSQLVEIAFVGSRTTEPVSGDWVTASWLGSTGTTREAGVLVGPGAHVLAEGTWYLWFRLTDSPEVPARYAGTLRIT